MFDFNFGWWCFFKQNFLLCVKIGIFSEPEIIFQSVDINRNLDINRNILEKFEFTTSKVVLDIQYKKNFSSCLTNYWMN